ncbi:MAG: hypothetical protein A3G33_05525 [Omnitrophica bacterium RIFCSPLOWO2_12_FULL_44_17]|uniref:Uncharacterized protein n=1 Tax=Candidatus Danuiimicrobium aquiferis TaxID=1801832 RepID=A0A1G1L1S9_9BACT|nr:MAG: hypothetical protein A3B72_05445 [Omnitrophica bacterium RIFCSPHIGHO2_02_FULL_45_28]OGW89409.1 MAG: hypothetical protein A3E74_00550 [Omnitrophica bacterium RIFCSPHIGHO2_12_FULL_44_12]OGW99086.1 MAG: hypothetical protein A3G33_05525 [Omnitrophica bacterium RIFCSPLOWO2_12_FULL_44_17]OGX04348.1 MAG: hypothetical protein A3J12_09005 [Omnitrophica bacterium RIFCSPLOWO2_02_FULL_44_11]
MLSSPFVLKSLKFEIRNLKCETNPKSEILKVKVYFNVFKIAPKILVNSVVSWNKAATILSCPLF